MLDGYLLYVSVGDGGCDFGDVAERVARSGGRGGETRTPDLLVAGEALSL